MHRAAVVLSCLLSCAPLALHAAADDRAANLLWNRIETLRKSPEPAVPTQVSGESGVTQEYLEALAVRGARLGDMLLELVEKYPADSRHWDAVLALAEVDRPIFKGFGNVRTEGWNAAIHDEAAEKAWKASVIAQIEQMIAAPGVPKEKMQAAYENWVDVAGFGSRFANLTEFRRRIDVMHAKFPSGPMRSVFEAQYLALLRTRDAPAVLPYLTKMTHDSDADISSWAQGQINTDRLRQTPMELAFTALDGRQVDLAKLHGKVVLVDFWATFCGPCVEDLPNVVKVYETLHGQGFEIISISLDTPTDRKKVVAFVKQHKLPWPQQFDGVHEKNEVAELYGIRALPTMFLLDKSGRLVSAEVRAEGLEPEVRRLLGSLTR